MSAVKLAIIYYSTYGTNHQMAEIAAEAARAAGAEVRLLKVAETAPKEVVAGQDAWAAHAEKTSDVPTVSHDDMVWADAYLFSAPTRYGSAPSQLRAFIDTLGPLWQQGKLANKAVSAMTSASTPHGGQEATTLGLYTSFMHWGALIVAPGYTHEKIFVTGNPYGYSHKQGDAFDDTAKTVIGHQAKRLVEVAGKLTA
ncbi:TrpR binding protein WrbA [Defluviimonas sp. 20V17]|uniref:NAD(P)H dehydrogenase (Quinone) n=1 Tax=Allgaiera indica TaxID=765699 RepID=A0AAN4UNJ9_9RHOB|nr:NAD(P)H:quinone oxidoreductase type IV [Allgaiera indica]KDB02190.1 TrpR binding protein WrbA [Defluviimonas sp. 20V17]GHD98817.1 trp repressor-binding protein WrbA [Allgaiera indica]SDW05521.1 NAD(P)H dehydrogenase (quinone) [Allgaiera indica]